MLAIHICSVIVCYTKFNIVLCDVIGFYRKLDMEYTVQCIHPETQDLTTTTLYVEELHYGPNEPILNELSTNGKGWKMLKLIEPAYGLARFHSNSNEPKGNYITLLYSLSPDQARDSLELNGVTTNQATYKTNCKVKAGAEIWVGKHLNSDNDQCYVADLDMVEYSITDKS